MDNWPVCVILDSQEYQTIPYPVDSFHSKVHCPQWQSGVLMHGNGRFGRRFTEIRALAEGQKGNFRRAIEVTFFLNYTEGSSMDGEKGITVASCVPGGAAGGTGRGQAIPLLS